MNTEYRKTYLDDRGYYRFEWDHKLVHRAVYREAGNKIHFGWVIHHIDGNKQNNGIENLIALPDEVHNALHWNWGMHALPNRGTIVLFMAKAMKRVRENRPLLRRSRKQKKRALKKVRKESPKRAAVTQARIRKQVALIGRRIKAKGKLVVLRRTSSGAESRREVSR